jgi:hypothetical protein
MAAARQVVPTGDGLGATWRALGGSMASSVRRRIGKRAGDWLGHDQAHADQRPVALAQAALAAQLDVALRQDTAQLIALHGLKGDAHSEILARLDAHFAVRLRVAEGNAALWGGVLTGALVGLKADIASGGLTLGGGALAGGLLGALGAAGLARGVNLVRGTQDSWLNWNAEALDHACDAALLRYLAVAHFGRGRGDWAQSEAPAHWQAVVTDALAPQRAALAALWASRSKNGAAAADATLMVLALRPLITQATRAALDSLYPGRWTADTPPDKTV